MGKFISVADFVYCCELVPGDCVMAVGDKPFADVCVNACDDFALGKKPEIHASFVRSCLCFVYYI